MIRQEDHTSTRSPNLKMKRFEIVNVLYYVEVEKNRLFARNPILQNWKKSAFFSYNSHSSAFLKRLLKNHIYNIILLLTVKLIGAYSSRKDYSINRI
jgi:hypothetical protein